MNGSAIQAQWLVVFLHETVRGCGERRARGRQLDGIDRKQPTQVVLCH